MTRQQNCQTPITAKIWVPFFGPLHRTLNHILAGDRIKGVITSLSDADIAGTFNYKNLRTGDHFTDKPLAHIFNHQTHHRGQAHTLMSQLGRNPTELDILYCIR